MNSFDEKLIKEHLPKESWESAFLKLKEGYPVQYIIGNVDFYDCQIIVNDNVLIPRFETEYLVQDVLSLMKQYNFVSGNLLDIGTGSGCIAIALAKNTSLNITALDYSKEALDIAQKNGNLNCVKINFILSKIEDYIPSLKYDVIVSNPPYVPYNSIVDPKTKYEPQHAIFAENNGLYFYECILKQSQKLLNKRFLIAFEIGDNQADLIANMAKQYYPAAQIIAKNDLNGINRYIYIINE